MITFTLTIQLESTDLTDLIDNADWGRWLSALPTPSTPPMPPAPSRPEETTALPVAARRQYVRKQHKTTEQPVLREADAVAVELPTQPSAHEIEAIPSATEAPATSDVETKPPTRNTRPQPTLSYDEFDRLARSELKRLSVDGRLPGHKLWESERSPRLPTLRDVLQRYKCATLAELANLVGLEPPLFGAHAPLGLQNSSQ